MDVAELIDLPTLQRLMQSLHEATGLPYALVDNQSRVLIGVGWEEICTAFHRRNPVTASLCEKSDRHILSRVEAVPYVGYRCPLGLMDYATPLIIEGEHLANIFTGQLLNSPPDVAFFQRQAQQFGFDRYAYLEAVKRIPVVSEERVTTIMAFLAELARLLASNGLNRLRQLRAEQDLLALNRDLAALVEERTAALRRKVEEQNQTREELSAANAELQSKIEEVSSLHEQVRQQAIRDPLTGLYNRRFLDETLPRMLSQASRLNYPVTVAIGDIDHFKQVNDVHGHQAGDKLLRWIATILQSITRIGDVACRMGGEEFVLVFPGMKLSDAAERVDEVRMHIAREPLLLGSLQVGNTISFGVAAFPDHAEDAENLLGAADDALYCAKKLGRNRSVLYGPSDLTAL